MDSGTAFGKLIWQPCVRENVLRVGRAWGRRSTLALDVQRHTAPSEINYMAGVSQGGQNRTPCGDHAATTDGPRGALR